MDRTKTNEVFEDPKFKADCECVGFWHKIQVPHFEVCVEGVIHCAAERRPDIAEKVCGQLFWQMMVLICLTGSRWRSKGPLNGCETQIPSLILIQLNVDVPASLAQLSKRHDFTLIYISTGLFHPSFSVTLWMMVIIRLRIRRDISTLYTFLSNEAHPTLWPNKTWWWSSRVRRGWSQSNSPEGSCSVRLSLSSYQGFLASFLCFLLYATILMLYYYYYFCQVRSSSEELRFSCQHSARCRARPVRKTLHHGSLCYAIPNKCPWYRFISCTVIWYIPFQ
jgi:hypothetical protein